MVYAGGGVILNNAAPQLTRLVRLLGFPCTNTLMGLGGFPGTDPQFTGMLGMHGTYETNMAMQHCDVLIAIGARFDDRVIGNPAHFFRADRKIIHIDIDPSSISKRVQGRRADRRLRRRRAGRDAEADRRLAAAPGRRGAQGVVGRDQGVAAQGLPAATTATSELIKPQFVIEKLYEVTRATRSSPPTSASTRCGRRSSTSSTSRGAGSTPAASARWASACRRRWACSSSIPDATVACVTGEASIQMCIQELSTCKQYHLPIKVVNLNNRYMGMVRQWQEFFYGNRYAESYMDALPDFVKLAEAYGHVGMKIEKPGDVEGALREAFKLKDRLVFLDFITDQTENVFPMVPGRQGADRDDPGGGALIGADA